MTSTKQWCAVALLGLGLGGFLTVQPVEAQPATRQEVLERQRAEKARQTRPFQRSKFEALLYRLDEDRLVKGLLNPRQGLFARLGGFVEGSGLGAGPAFRLSSADVRFTVSAAGSAKGYWLAESRLELPRLARRHVTAEVTARRRDFPQEDFYGLGSGSLEEQRSNFALRETSASGMAAVRLGSFTGGGRVEYLTPRIGRGTDRKFLSIEAKFTDRLAPGLDVQPDFMRYEAFVDVNYRDPLENPRSGGRYVLSFSRYEDRDLDRYSFRRLDVDVQQHVPLLRRYRSIALRGAASFSDADRGHQVPFYLQRTIGGAYTLRGYRSYRFRDENFLLLQAEYRYEVNSFITGALFYEAGKVAPTRHQINLRDLKRDYGFGLRVGSRDGVAMRVDLALGGESPRLLVRFNDVF